MAVMTRFATRQIGPCFAAEVEGIDMTRPLTPEEVAAIHAGMDRYAVLVFHDQPIDDEQQLAFTRSLGAIEHSVGTSLREPGQYRLPTTFADVSNLDENQKVFERDDRRRLFGLGNRLWHSDSSFKVTPAKYSLLHARAIPSKGGNTEFADMRAAYDALDAETRAQVEDLVCEHSQIFSRQQLGFTDFTDEERERFKPVRQRLVRTHPVTGRKSLYLASHAGGILGWPVPEARAFLRDLVEHATQREFVYSHPWRVGDLVMWDNRQTMHRARPFPAQRAARRAPHHAGRRRPHRAPGRLRRRASPLLAEGVDHGLPERAELRGPSPAGLLADGGVNQDEPAGGIDDDALAAHPEQREDPSLARPDPGLVAVAQVRRGDTRPEMAWSGRTRVASSIQAAGMICRPRQFPPCASSSPSRA